MIDDGINSTVNKLGIMLRERDAELAAVRRALGGYDDSNLASLAETVMAQRRLLAEARCNLEDGQLTYDEAISSLRLAHSIVNDEPAPASNDRAGIPGYDAAEYDILQAIAQAGQAAVTAYYKTGVDEETMHALQDALTAYDGWFRDADDPAPDDERARLGEALIRWAARPSNIFDWDEGLKTCVLCGGGYHVDGEVWHAPDCLHLRARKLQEASGES